MKLACICLKFGRRWTREEASTGNGGKARGGDVAKNDDLNEATVPSVAVPVINNLSEV